MWRVCVCVLTLTAAAEAHLSALALVIGGQKAKQADLLNWN